MKGRARIDRLGRRKKPQRPVRAQRSPEAVADTFYSASLPLHVFNLYWGQIPLSLLRMTIPY